MIERDFEIVKRALRGHPTIRGLTEGHIVRYEGELFFVYESDENVNIEECDSWRFDIEKKFCFEDYDPDFYHYYEADSILVPLSLNDPEKAD
jgi:hypothetical protein